MLTTNSVAVVLCSHLLEHLRDDVAGIEEIGRVMAPGAIAYIIVPIDSRLEETVFFGEPNPDIFDHYWSHGLDFIDKLSQFECTAIMPLEVFSKEDVRRYGLSSQEVIYRCVKPESVG